MIRVYELQCALQLLTRELFSCVCSAERLAGKQATGPALGGLAIAAMSPAIAILVTALTYFFSAGCVLAMRVPTGDSEPADTEGPRTIFGDLHEGWGYVRRTRWLLASLLFGTVFVLLILGPLEVLRGRIASLDFFVSLLLMPLSMALAGPAGAVLGLATVFLIAGIGPALISLLVVHFGRMPSDEIAHPLDHPVESAPTPA
jgi:hypothetical protein